MKKLIITICMLCVIQLPARAGFVEGASAYNNKNYALAYKEILPWPRPAMPMPSICWA
jgi:hypothetical protein